MWTWIKELEPEFLIIFIGLILAVIINIAIWIKTSRTLNLIDKRALTLKEDLVIRDDKKVIDILISNTTFISVKVAAIGYIYQKNLLPISEEVTEISPRDSEKTSVEIDALRAYLIDEKMKVKRLKLYVEDTLGRRSIQRAKDTYRALKKMIKEEKKAIKKAAKIKRSETGKYNFIERVGLIFKFIFSPISKLNYIIKTGLNKRLKERESRLVIKKKERDHKEFLKSIAEEDRREKDLSDVEKRIEKERAELEHLQAEKKKEAELEKQKLEQKLKKIEKEKAQIEAEKIEENNVESSEIVDENEVKMDENIAEQDVQIEEKTEEKVEDKTEKIEENVDKEVEKPVKKTTKKKTNSQK
ncbi:MAG: hypothetical protein WC219_02615 [Acholeplasmataceae bacterium]